ncbi:uncharacterized protein LOC119552795 isoform X2 [Drosophila subpulchrella]|uniref:uncharacterized protein LOC119552795 isoform X2 n=1 Tax=Drosophila subpulchrella TaxID=1486046 RepID=UPI0018A13448|nr:uncharacterized protein LOC119552795 isoform X2 [Drosophila subpulchrella]
MLDSQEDGTNAEMQSEVNAVDKMEPDPKTQCPVLHSQSSKGSSSWPEPQASEFTNQSDVGTSLATSLEESFKVDCSLPSLPLDTLLSPFNIIDQLRKQSEVKDLLDFQSGLGDLSLFGKYEPSLSSKSECSKESQVPYFIPELEMACAEVKVNEAIEVNPPEIESSNTPEIKILDIPPIKESIMSGKKEATLPRIEAPNCTILEEINLANIEDINSYRTEEGILKAIEEKDEHKSEESNPQEFEKLMCSADLKRKSVGLFAPKTLQIDELIAPLVEKAKPKMGLISSLIGNKLALTPSVRLSFGDRVVKRKNMQEIRSKEIIQQQASRSLKALILSLTMLKNLEASYHDNSHQSRLNRFQRVRSSLNFSRVFRQNIFQLTSEVKGSKKEIKETSLCCGEPIIESPSIYKEPLPLPYQRLDASEGLTCNGLNVSKDSVFSEVSESDDSEIQNKLCVKQSFRGVHGLPRSMADLNDILNSGRGLFSQPVRLFCFNKLKEWKRQGEGQIEILEHQGSYYIILHDKVTGELIIHMRVDERWRIDYMTNSSYSCRWTNINYASSREGILERIACSFREPSHAAEFVARVRNSAIQSRFE